MSSLLPNLDPVKE
jgi:hypothetical protein